MQGTEAHDQLLGQVFGYAAIIRSGQRIDQETAVKCAQGLTHIASKKAFLRELTANVILELTGANTACFCSVYLLPDTWQLLDTFAAVHTIYCIIL